MGKIFLKFKRERGEKVGEAKVLTIYGEPVGKGRPRFTQRGGFVQTYTPEKTKAFEQRVAAEWQREYGKFSYPAKVQRCLGVVAYFEPAKSLSKKKRAAILGTMHTNKPDGDNIAKSVMDGLQGVAFPDDAAVSCHSVAKMWDEVARTEVAIWEVE